MPSNLISRLVPWWSVPKEAHLGPSGLECLPLEMLHMILQYLSLDEAAALTCCNRSLLAALGHQWRNSLRDSANEQDRRRFLQLLQRDLPNLLFCHHCGNLHPLDHGEDLHSIGPSDSLLCSKLDGSILFMPWSRIRFEYAQMIMKVVVSLFGMTSVC